MKWININANKLPLGEVIAANFRPFTYGYKEKLIGSLYSKDGMVVCENEYELLENCTHYILLSKFDILK
jgi:hypothetical protein